MFSNRRYTLSKTVTPITLVAAVLVVLHYSDQLTMFQKLLQTLANEEDKFELVTPQDHVDKEIAQLPQHAYQCVPFYNLISQKVTVKGRDLGDPSNAITPLAAYMFPTYAAVTFEDQGWNGRKLYCWYKDDQSRQLGHPVESVVYPVYVVYCCRHPKARYLGVSAGKSSSHGIAFKEVIVRKEGGTKYILSHCLAKLRGVQPSWLLLAELIEHYKLLGVQHFYIYVLYVDPYSRRLLDDYIKTGEVEAVFFKFNEKTQFHLISIQDCIIRSRYHSRYVILSDLDERIVTKSADEDLLSFVLSTMERHKNVGSLTFWSRFVFRTSKPPLKYKREQTLRHLPTLVFHNTTETKAQNYIKCIVDPHRILDMGVHNVEEFLGNYTNLYIPMCAAYIRHYRDPFERGFRMDHLPSIESTGTFQKISYPQRLMQRLFENVKKRLDRVYLKGITQSAVGEP
ncbi:hypothetical protein Q1695_005814 [Nippostrongylus brasiliensis]|nr:hypothetical protein Q1695_005814 [Nippostrongylus brasiliensis]